MMDFNNFKSINDDLGHKQGDLVLKEYAAKIDKIATLNKGKAYRLGGDEFALLIPSEVHFKFETVIDDLNKIVKAHHEALSIAYGVEKVHHDNVNENHRAEDIMAKADKQMYTHKFNLKQKQ
jgi:diguanylate cyclase (GGDEF)-like protein